MGNKLLKRYIEDLLKEVNGPARVPSQLVSSDEHEHEEDGNEDEGNDGVDEFSSCGAGSIAGYTAPLGMSPDRLGRKKNRPKH